MTGTPDRIQQSKAERRDNRKAPSFAPAGQSTQMIGATDATDATILTRAKERPPQKNEKPAGIAPPQASKQR